VRGLREAAVGAEAKLFEDSRMSAIASATDA
jgi:hypothetical protein